MVTVTSDETICSGGRLEWWEKKISLLIYVIYEMLDQFLK